MTDALLEGLDDLVDGTRELYTHLHAHPELSMHEQRTARVAAARLEAAGAWLR